MAIDFNQMKSMEYKPKDNSISVQATAFQQPSNGKQPDYVGTGTINFKGEIVPIEIAVWQNTKSIKITGTKK